MTEGAEEGVAIATGLKQARLLLANHSDQHALEPSDLYENQSKNNTAEDDHSSDFEDTVKASKK